MWLFFIYRPLLNHDDKGKMMRIKKGLALCGCILALSACDYFGKGGNDAGPSRKLDALIDAELAAMRLSLPQKMADEFDMTDTRRVGKDVTYTYQFNTQEHKASTFDAETGKQVAIPELCNTKATREYLDAGYRFVFTYLFKDGSDVVVHITAADCKA